MRSTSAESSAIVRIEDDAGRVCTGTYILPDVVLTAAHCLAHGPPGRLRVGEGEAARAATRFMVDPRFPAGRRDVLSPHDVGLLVVRHERSAPHGTTLRLRRTPLEPHERVTLVGYGRQDRGQGTVRREGEDVYMPGNGVSPSGVEDTVATVARWTGLLYLESGLHDTRGSIFGDPATPGDSGGPLLGLDGRIAGVVVASSRLDAAARPHRVTWAVDVSSPGVERFLSEALGRLGVAALAWRLPVAPPRGWHAAPTETPERI